MPVSGPKNSWITATLSTFPFFRSFRSLAGPVHVQWPITHLASFIFVFPRPFDSAGLCLAPYPWGTCPLYKANTKESPDIRPFLPVLTLYTPSTPFEVFVISLF